MKKVSNEELVLDDIGVETVNPVSVLKYIVKHIVSLIMIPVAIIKWALKPKWKHIYLFEKLVSMPFVEYFLGERSASTSLHKMYDDVIAQKTKEGHTGTKAFYRANYETMNNIVNEFRYVRGLTIFAVFLFYAILYEIFDVLSLLVLGAGGASIFASGLHHGTNFLLAGGGWLMTILSFFIYALSAWFAFVAIMLILKLFKEMNTINGREIKQFITTLMGYTLAKTQETYGIETAEFAYKAIIDNVCLEDTKSYQILDEITQIEFKKVEAVLSDKKELRG